MPDFYKKVTANEMREHYFSEWRKMGHCVEQMNAILQNPQPILYSDVEEWVAESVALTNGIKALIKDTGMFLVSVSQASLTELLEE